LRNTDPAGYSDAYRIFAAEVGAADTDLNAIQCPVLCLTGGDEPNSTPDMSRKIVELAPKARAEIIDGAAHMLPMTHASKVNAVLSEFIKASL
jgi:pimeloyl-ACP methyl ester carboxylesterase